MAKGKPLLQVHVLLTFIIVAALLVAAYILHFRMQGYDTLAIVCVAAAVIVALLGFVTAILARILLILVAIVIALLLVAEVPIIGAWKGTSDGTQPYLVVLGAKVNGTEPSKSLLYRLQGALAYLEGNPSSVAIVSGARGIGEAVSEAQCMKDWLVGQGIDASRIIVEDQSKRTTQNLEYSFRIVEERGGDPSCDVAVASSAYHLYRVKLLSKAMGEQVQTVSCFCGKPLLTVNYCVREGFAVWAQWLDLEERLVSLLPFR